MNCGIISIELVECARRGTRLDAGVADHLSDCPRCRERWEAEQLLTSQFRRLRASAALRPAFDVRRTQILEEFAEAHRRARAPRDRWMLALSAAAVLVLSVALGYVWLARSKGPVSPIIAARKTTAVQQSLDASIGEAYAGDVADEGGFVQVPYAPPLASGEFVRVVRTELRPAALARMGLDVDVTETGEIPADVVVGEDGLPRAVRVVDEILF